MDDSGIFLQMLRRTHINLLNLQIGTTFRAGRVDASTDGGCKHITLTPTWEECGMIETNSNEVMRYDSKENGLKEQQYKYQISLKKYGGLGLILHRVGETNLGTFAQWEIGCLAVN